MQIDTRKLKKLIIKAVPYVAFSYVGNLIGFAYRTAEGDGFQEKILPFMSNLGVAFAFSMSSGSRTVYASICASIS